MLPKTRAYVKSHDGQTKWINLFIENDDLLKEYNTIWNKVSADIEKEFDGEPVYIKEFLETKIKSHGDEVIDFYDKKVPNVCSNDTCLALITLDSAVKKDDNYYVQMFLKECKCVQKKVVSHIHDNLSDFSSSDESEEQ